MAVNPSKLHAFSIDRPIRNDPDYALWMEGVKTGEKEMKVKVLGMLQKRFMDPKIDRTTPEGAAMLAIATIISQDIKIDG